MTTAQSIATILVIVLGTVLTRALPFLLFPGRQVPPPYIRYLGKVLPPAVLGFLVVYCLKDAPSAGFYALPELLAVLCVASLQRWHRNALLSIAGGTLLYMFLVQTIFG